MLSNGVLLSSIDSRDTQSKKVSVHADFRMARDVLKGLARPQGRGFRLVRRGPIPPPTTPGPSVWA